MRWCSANRAGRVWFGSLAWVTALALSGRAESPRPVDFAHDIVPIIKARCAECHTNGKYKGSFSLDTRAEVLKSKNVVPGKSDASKLVQRIRSDDPKKRMPPKDARLSAAEVQLIANWIDQGLKWEDGFTFKKTTYVAPLKPRRPALPPIRDGRDHPIDRILDAYFAQHKLSFPAPADDVTFMRRVYLDTIGLLPSREEVDAFVQDASPNKRIRLAQRVLGDNRAFTEHWLTFWNDLLRNDYAGVGYTDGGRKQITGWLYQSLFENRPYDQFVRELLDPSPDSEGFILGIKWRGNVNASQVREVQFAQNVGQVFFGVNIKCASCHDSFIDTWKLDDAYGLAAVVAEKPLEIHRCDKPQGRTASPRFLWPELGTIDAKLPKAQRLKQLAMLVTHPDNGRFTRTIANRIWHRFMGHGLVHPVDVMANRPWNEDLLDYLGVYLADNGHDLKNLMQHIIASRAYQARPALIANEQPTDDYIFRGPEVKRMTAEQFMDAVWQVTHTAPAKPGAAIRLPAFGPEVPRDRQFIRASLVKPDLLMRSLGRPNREQVVTTRGDVLTTLQALDLSNGQVLTTTLSRGAVNLLKAHSRASSEQLIELIYRQALSRRPSEAELVSASTLVGSRASAEGLADLLWAVFMLPEFQLIR